MLLTELDEARWAARKSSGQNRDHLADAVAVERVMAKMEKELRARLGDKFVDGIKSISKQRDDFKTDLINAIENGKAGPAMAEFLNERAWLWKYLERDPEFKANLE